MWISREIWRNPSRSNNLKPALSMGGLFQTLEVTGHILSQLHQGRRVATAMRLDPQGRHLGLKTARQSKRIGIGGQFTVMYCTVEGLGDPCQHPVQMLPCPLPDGSILFRDIQNRPDQHAGLPVRIVDRLPRKIAQEIRQRRQR